MRNPGYRFIDPPEPDDRIVAYELHGHVSAEDMRAVLEHLEAAMETHARLRLFQDVTHYQGFELSALREKFKHLGKLWHGIEKVAVVGDSRWMEIYIGVVDPITPQQIKYFPTGEEEAAFAWLKE